MGTAEQEATAWKLAKENLERENAALRTKCAMLSGALKGALALAGTAPAPSKEYAEQLENLCATIKTEDDYCIDQAGYMLDSNDCIKIIRGEWVRPDFSTGATHALRTGGKP